MQSKDTIYYIWHVTIVNVFAANIYIYLYPDNFLVELELKKKVQLVLKNKLC